MKRMKMVLLCLISLVLALLIVQNMAPVRAHFLWLTAEVPVILLLFLTAAGSLVAGILVALLIESGAKPKP